MISFLLNFPYTLVGIVSCLVCFPYKVSFQKYPNYCFVFFVHKCWWAVGPYKYMRACVIGHTILLTDKVKKGDIEHELIHIEQYTKYPFIFPVLYYLESFKKGYRMNRFEDEAYTKSGSYYGKS